MNRPVSARPKTVATKPKLCSQNITFANTAKVSTKHKNESITGAISQLETSYTGRFNNKHLSPAKANKNLTAVPDY